MVPITSSYYNLFSLLFPDLFSSFTRKHARGIQIFQMEKYFVTALKSFPIFIIANEFCITVSSLVLILQAFAFLTAHAKRFFYPFCLYLFSNPVCFCQSLNLPPCPNHDKTFSPSFNRVQFQITKALIMISSFLIPSILLVKYFRIATSVFISA